MNVNPAPSFLAYVLRNEAIIPQGTPAQIEPAIENLNRGWGHQYGIIEGLRIDALRDVERIARRIWESRINAQRAGVTFARLLEIQSAS
jgi:hypothetical protein